jgi:hypothetical protein
MDKAIRNTADVIDSRDVIERIEWLQDQERTAEESEELTGLLAVAKEGEASPDWNYGEALIRESYFTDYIEQLIDDCYSLPEEMNSGVWPWRHITIDFEAAAEEAKADYIEVDFDGVTYLIRA